jgi:hypothetical protein
MSDGDEDAGTRASALGLAILTGLEKVWTLFRFVNSTRDMLADHFNGILGAHSADQITGQLTMAQLPATWTGDIDTNATIETGSIIATGNLNATANMFLGSSAKIEAGSLYTPVGRSTPVTSSYVAAYINSDGRVGATPSAKRFKRHLRKYKVPASFLDLQPVVYYLKDDPQKVPRLGFYAEDVNDVEPLLVVHEDGKPFSIRYEQWGVALHAAVKARFTELEKRIAELEKGAS